MTTGRKGGKEKRGKAHGNRVSVIFVCGKYYLRLIGLRYVLFRADQICLGTSGQPTLGAHVLDILSQLPIFHYFLDHCVDCIFVGWLGCTSSGGVVIRKVPADP